MRRARGRARRSIRPSSIEYLEARMPAYWVPRFVEYLDELPRTESHKLKKAELREAGITAGDVGPHEGAEARKSVGEVAVERRARSRSSTGAARLVAGRCAQLRPRRRSRSARAARRAAATSSASCCRRAGRSGRGRRRASSRSRRTSPTTASSSRTASATSSSPGSLRVEGRLTEADPERLRIGMAMEVVAVERARPDDLRVRAGGA